MVKRLLLSLLLLSSGLLAQNSAVPTSGPITASASSCQPSQGNSTACVFLAVPPSVTVSAIQVTGTWSATLQFEWSPDGTNFYTLASTPNGGGSTVTSATANGAWTANVGGASVIRVRCSAFTSGTAQVYLNPSFATTGSGLTAGGGGSGTVNPNNLAAGAVANYPAAGGSSAVSPTTLNYVAPTLTVSTAGGGNGVLALSGNTSGTATITAPAVAGTVSNPFTFSNVINVNGGSAGNVGYGFNGAASTGWYSTGAIFGAVAGTPSVGFNATIFRVPSNSGYSFGSGDASTASDTGTSRTAADVVAFGNGIPGDESGLARWNTCKVTADITLTVNTAVTVCTWNLPAVAKAWGWQCKIPWVISAGTGTNTLAISVNPSQTPTGTTNGSAEIKTTNTNTATEATTAISASGGTTLLTSGTITPAATVFLSSTSGTLLASATAGTFAIQMTAAGTTATAAAKAGATCELY